MSVAVYLDLDRTLYRTDLGTELIWREIQSLHPEVSTERGQERLKEFYLQNGDLYAYDFSSHLRAIGLNVGETYRQLEGSDLADGKLEYEGVSQLVEWIRVRGEVRVLTYGMDDFQRLKARLCPSLRGVEVITTLEPKSEFFKQAGLTGEVWMVDDKPIGGELPKSVQFIQVAHGGTMTFSDAQWPTSSSLDDVLTLLQKLT